jgi:hypothetical protein
VVTQSELRSAETGTALNSRAEVTGRFSSDGGECPAHKPTMSSADVAGLDIDPSELKLPRFSPDELVGKVLVRSWDDGKNYHAKVVRKIQDHDADCHKNINKFLVERGDGEYDEIITYNKLWDTIETQGDQETHPEEPRWTFSFIEGHKGPIKKGHPKGSSYNVLVKWEDGSQSYEPLDAMAADDPITLALYACANNLLDTPGWKRFRHIATAITKECNKIRSMIHQYHVSKGKQTHGPIFKFGIQVPRSVKEAYELDAKHGNTKWQDSMKEEIDALLMFITFMVKFHI